MVKLVRFMEFGLAFAGAVLATIVHAQSTDVHVCIDENGTRTYQNTGGGKGCKKLNLEPLTSVPAPKVSATVSGGGTGSGTGTGGASAPSRGIGAPARYDPSAQDRLFDRRRILEDEMRKEESRLAELKAEYNNGQPERRGDEKNYQKYLDRSARLKDEIARSDGNVQALQRELAKLKE
ncbi:MAG: DUF4124 domain-containing protein [Burkholderiaceae bacterium]